jgi:hypothetical protein
MSYPAGCLIGLNPVIYNKKRKTLLDIFRQYLKIIDHCPIEVVGHTLQGAPGEEIPLSGEKMVIKDINNYAGVAMVFPGEMDLAAVNYRVPVGKSVNMSVQYNSPPHLLRIFEIITAFHIVSYIIAYDNLIRVARKVYVSKNIHTESNTTKNLPYCPKTQKHFL